MRHFKGGAWILVALLLLLSLSTVSFAKQKVTTQATPIEVVGY